MTPAPRGKAAKTVGDTAKARVDMLGETATEFKAGVEGVPVMEPPAAEGTPAEAPPRETAPAQLPAADGLGPATPREQ